MTGGRQFGDWPYLRMTLDLLHMSDAGPIEHVAHGNYAGVDLMADAWAKSRGIPRTPYPADWTAQGRAAGPIRNRRMLKAESPDLVVAFPGGAGTADCVKAAREFGFNVHHVPESSVAQGETVNG